MVAAAAPAIAAGPRKASLVAAPTVLVFLIALDGVLLADEQGGWVLLFLLGQSVPLLWLRTMPRAVLLAVTAVTATQLCLGLPMSNGVVAQAVAVAAVVARTPSPVSALPVAAVLLANLIGAAVGQLTDATRFLALTGLALVLGWVVGDAARRRAEVRAATEQELAERLRHARLRSEVSALSERLHIARELHDLVGEALDSVVVQAGAARARLPHGDIAAQTDAIESVGRGVLAELDRFLALLARGTPDTAPGPVGSPVPVQLPENRRPGWFGPHLASAGPALGVGLIAFIDVSDVPGAFGLPDWWPAVYSAALSALLLLRHRYPELVLAVVTLMVSVPLLSSIQVDNAVLAVPVAAHAVIARRSRRRGLVAGGVSLVAVLLATAGVSLQDAAQASGVLPIIQAVALYAGDSSRGARQLDRRLHQRIREVEEQGLLREHAAVSEERARAARDLHDSLGHTLSLIVLQAGAARLAMTSAHPSVERADEALAAVERSARSALEDMDASLDVVMQDQPEPGPVLPGAADLPVLVDAVRAAGTPVTVSRAPLDDLPRSYQATVFRVVQEALTNVVKHAPGSHATVELLRTDELVRVTVRNSPRVATPSELPSGRRGLTGMGERVAMVGGRLRAGPTPGGGYVVGMEIPVRSESTDNGTPTTERTS